MFLILVLAAAGGAEIIDRVAAVVERQVITHSDVQREVRLEAFFGQKPPPREIESDSDPYREARRRLIEQRLVQHEMEQATLPGATEAEVTKWLEQMRPRSADPARYGLREHDLRDYARRQLDIEQFIDIRFRPGSQPARQRVQEYYQKTFLPELARRGIEPKPPLDEVRSQLEEVLVEERINELMEEWLKELRSRVRVKVVEPETP